MIDENDPVVRAVQAPFEQRLGEFRQQMNQANTTLQQEATALAARIAERDAKAVTPATAQPPAKPKAPLPDWEDDDPLASRPKPVSWQPVQQPPQQSSQPPLPPPQPAPPRRPRQPLDDDYDLPGTTWLE